jgi:hypothetical protein
MAAHLASRQGWRIHPFRDLLSCPPDTEQTLIDQTRAAATSVRTAAQSLREHAAERRSHAEALAAPATMSPPVAMPSAPTTGLT